jgi:(p)ppGpp synthase/HD superfamily hydrolase
MTELILVLRAAELAARWHVHQRRKGHAAEPYANHLLEVASLVTQATDGSEPNVTIAALLYTTRLKIRALRPKRLQMSLASQLPISC